MPQINHTINFENFNPTFSTIIAPDQQAYIRIKAEDFTFVREEGSPELPIKIIRLIIPNNTSVENIEIINYNKTELSLTEPIYPVQNFINNQTFIEPELDIYNSSNPFPNLPVQVIKHDIFDGHNRLVTLAIFPILYYPMENKVELISSIQFSLLLKEENYELIYPKNRLARNQELYDDILKNIISNPNDIEKFSTKLTTTSNNINKILRPTPVEFFEYVIITSNTLKPAFDNFVNWKKRKGIDIGVVTTSSISYYYTGDYVSGIFDEAGKIRQYLRDAYEVGTVWVLLGGDLSVVPSREGYILDNAFPSSLIGYSDLYFADWNGDWNVDGDDKYGEPNNDAVDYAPELFVGRLLCSTSQDIQNWYNKILKYEQYPGNGDYNYLNRNMMVQSDEAQEFNSANIVIQKQPLNFSTTTYSELPDYNSTPPIAPYANDIIDNFNLNKYGMWFWFAHGYETSTKTMSYGVNGVTLSGFNTTNLLNLSNVNYPSILYSTACENARYEANPNLAKTYTVGSTSGGPAFLGNTAEGTVQQADLTRGFMSLLCDDPKLQRFPL